MRCDVCIVGAGPAGITCGRLLADKGFKVLIIEVRPHIGGNLYDYYNQHGILIHKFGPHFFRTEKDTIWQFLSQFTEWHPYEHKVLTSVKGQLVPFPINVDTYNMLHNTNLSNDEFVALLQTFHRYESPRNAEEAAINQVGEYMYELFIKHYTQKQWGHHPIDLDPETIRRIRVRTDREDRYQPMKYQAIPLHGYTQMFRNMVQHQNISILLQTDYKSVINDCSFDALIYTGALDYYFDFGYGELEYRSLRLVEKTYYTEEYQRAAVINYPNNYDYTRITEYKKMTGQQHPFTTVHFEYPMPYIAGKNTAYYPILNESNLALRQRYIDAAQKQKRVFFIGRLAEYKYYAMDEIFEAAIQLIQHNF